MTKYLIKTTYDATEKNETHYGKENAHQEYYLSKGGRSSNQIDWYVLEKAYTRLCDAERVLKTQLEWAKREMETGYWIRKEEIIEVEC